MSTVSVWLPGPQKFGAHGFAGFEGRGKGTLSKELRGTMGKRPEIRD